MATITVLSAVEAIQSGKKLTPAILKAVHLTPNDVVEVQERKNRKYRTVQTYTLGTNYGGSTNAVTEAVGRLQAIGKGRVIVPALDRILVAA